MNKKSILGYRKDSPFKNLPSIDIQSPHISMENVTFPILGTSLQTGEKKIMKPGKNYKFKNTKTVREIPILQDGGMSEHDVLYNYLSTLGEADQDSFIESYDNMTPHSKQLVLQNIITEDVILKKGGKTKAKRWVPRELYLKWYPNGKKKKKEDGGEIEDVPTYPSVPRSLAQTEVEKDETMLTPQGQLAQFGGKSHSDGGTPVLLEPGSKIFSEHLKVPQEIIKQVTGKDTKKKISFAKMSKKFPTENFRRILEDESSDEFELEGARLSLLKHQAMLETLFVGQEVMKGEKDSTNKMQAGGRVPASPVATGPIPTREDLGKYMFEGQYDLSDVSGRFIPQPNMGDNIFLDPITQTFIVRDPTSGLYNDISSEWATGTYDKSGVIPRLNSIPTPDPQFNPLPVDNGYRVVSSTKFPALATETPVFPDNLNPDGSTIPLDLVMPDRTRRELPKPVVKPGARKNSTPVTPSLATPPITPMGNFDPLGLVSSRGDYEVTSQTASTPSPVGLIRTIPTSSREAKESWWSKNKDKFGVNSKLAGTILDIGMTLSDSVTVKEPVLYDRRKTPIFNRFYEFDDKEVQKMYSTQIQQINNSNLPEGVKQAQLAEIMSNSQDYQGKVDFANAQRYEGKREADLNKLQSYMDANIETKVADLDSYRQRKARVDFLRDKFKSEQKAKVFNSVRNYLDYTEELAVTNELSTNFTVNPITGRLKVKPKQNTTLKDNLLQQYAQQQRNSQSLPGGATATQIGNLLIVTGVDGKIEIREIK